MAEDAAARRRLVQLPAHGRLRRPQGRGPDRRRVRGPRAHPRAGRVRAREHAGLRATATWSTSRRRPACARRACSKGEYVVTKEDVTERTRFADSVARGRDYYTPYRDAAAARRRRTCSSPAATTRRPRRRRRCRARSRPAWRWARPPAMAAALALDAGVARARRRCRQAAGAAARPGRRSGRQAGRQRHRRCEEPPNEPTADARSRSPASA